MAETKKQPGLFTADLFSSPPGQSHGESPATSGLSFGLSGDVFSSPFSLAPAMTSTQGRSPPTSRAEVNLDLSESPAKKDGSLSPAVPRGSPVISATPSSSVVMSTSTIAEMSNVPLDSPPPSSENTPATSGASISSHTTPHRPPPHPSVGPGWNDPPLQSTGSIPVADVATSDMYALQPLAGQPDTPQATPTAPPPTVSTAPVQSQVVNPYRLGQAGGKRVAYGTPGVPSYTTPPPAQPLQQAPPTSLPPSVPATYPPDLAQSQFDMSAVPAQQEVGVVSSGGVAQQLRQHWFYLRPNEHYWIPFSLNDSAVLEHTWATSAADSSQQVLVPTDGGRYDVDLCARSRDAIYWREPASQVRRCSWFYKGDSDRWYMPYPEDVAAKLEEAYMCAVGSGVWGGKVEVGEGEGVVLHSQSSMAHYPASQFRPIAHEVDYTHPHSVLRGFAEIDHVEQGEQSRIDHLVFVVHGIGQHHDLSFRCLVDCVDDFREVSQLMLRTHQFAGQAPREGDTGGRVEFLPVHWHAALHGDSMGVDTQLQKLSLNSISRLRGFTNSTLLDILFFTSPVYCQTIVDQVAGEMNRMYELFRQRNPDFSGGVSVIGHSLGSCILFDILAHQSATAVDGFSSTDGDNSQPSEVVLGEEVNEVVEEEEEDTPTSLETALSYLGLPEYSDVFEKEQIDFDSLLMISNDDLKELAIPMGPRKKISSFISTQGEKIRAAKERKARAEAERKAREKAVAKEQEEASKRHTRLQGVKYVKGEAGTGQPLVTFPQLHFKTENLFALGSPIGLFLIVRGVEELGPEYKLPHCHQIFNIFHPFDPVAYRLEPLVCETPPDKPVLMPHHKGRKRFHLELYETVEHVGASMKQYVVEGMRNMWQQLNELARSHRTAEQTQMMATEETDTPTISEAEVEVEKEPVVGTLNGGRRVDYVLQEKPIEKLNEYLFALSSHLSYWHSEDTALLILKEVYGEMNPELIKS